MPDERSVRCGECGAAEPESRMFDVPVYREEPTGWNDGWRCRGCFAATVDATRRRLQYTDAEDGDAGELEVLMLAAFFRARGAAPPAGAAEGAALKSALLQLLDEIESGARRLTLEERSVLCSACLTTFRESQIHVIPWFNDTVENYVTTFRCGGCWDTSLEQTRARLSVTDDAGELALLATFFERHGIFVLEFRRGDPPSVLKPILLQTLELVRREALILRIGETRPLDA